MIKFHRYFNTVIMNKVSQSFKLEFKISRLQRHLTPRYNKTLNYDKILLNNSIQPYKN